MHLKGKTAVVTGGARGIGKAIALRFAGDGAHVGILHRQEGSGNEVVQEVRHRGGSVLAIQCDVTNYEEVKGAVAIIYQEFGSIDILVNNAGVDIARSFVDTDEPLWDTMIAVNYKGFLIATHVCISYMIKQQAGIIISMGSDAGRIGAANEVVYSGTKAAIMASTKALARELARYNIRVNAVSPGPVQTELWDKLHEGEKGKKVTEAVMKAIPFRRLGTPEDVADVVAFFVSDDSRYVTGQVLSVDGGLTMIG